MTTIKDLFKEKAAECGFNLEKDKELLERIWSGIINGMLPDECKINTSIGELEKEKALKAQYLCKQFGFTVIPEKRNYRNWEAIEIKQGYELPKYEIVRE